MKKNYTELLFLVLLFVVAIIYNYPEITFKRPQSIHKWRQSDCASIALNYYQHGMHFFKPETHNLTSDNGTTGKCFTSEVPILYFGVATLYSVFGYHEYIYRIFNTLLFFLGLFYLFKLLRYIIKDDFWAIAITLLFFTSPVLVYYGNNFLSNSSALSLSIIAWYFFVRFIFERKPIWFNVSILIFFIAAAFKITALFSLIAISLIFLFELIGYKKFREGGKIFKPLLPYLLPVVLIFVILTSWLVYAGFFNQRHDCSYFSTTLFPIWELDKPGIEKVLDSISKIWLDQYFHPSVLAFLGICLLFILLNFKKLNKILIFSVLVIFFEVIAYIVLQFWTFKDHDYYVIDIYILPILLVITAFDLLNRNFQKFFNSVLFKSAFCIFLIFNIFYAHKQINIRYNGWMNDNPENTDLFTISPYLRQLGIAANDTVISIPDASHVSLYLMNQKGWTEYTDARFNRGPAIKYNQDVKGINASIDKGAGYLIINGIEELYYKPYLQDFCINLAGRYKDVLIFNLKDKERNFTLDERQIVKIYRCDAEHLSPDSLKFLGEPDSSIFESGKNQSNDFAHSGNYSSKCDAVSPYGMTIRLKDLKYGESFSICVWRKPTQNIKAGMVATSSPNSFYYTDYKLLEKDLEGWEKIQLEFFVPKALEGQELGVFEYNPEQDPVYFDDLEIIRYKSIFK